MPTQVTEDLIREVEHLVSAGHTYREVATALGCSSRTVDRIVNGDNRNGRKPMGRIDRTPKSKRCPECGGRYVTPTCRLCEVRAMGVA